MAEPVNVPTITDWLLALAPYVGIMLSSPLSYWLGTLKTNHDLKIENERLKAQAKCERENALRESREKRLKEWREAISRHTAMYTETRKTSFRYEDFSRTEAYLSLHGHLDEGIRRHTEGTYRGPNIMLGEMTPEENIRNQLLACIDKLETEWGLA